ncbi:MAG: hypothetical protein AAGA48_37915 [Myxococcota bacterium]
MHVRSAAFGLSLALAMGCGSNDDEPTYYGDAKVIIDAKCASCHQEGDIGPFPLTTFEELTEFAVPVRSSIENGTMPPWQPSDDCNSYEGNFDLTAAERETLMAWLDAEMPEGDPDDAPSIAPEAETFEAELRLQLPEPYTPQLEPDDYRCQLIPWPYDEPRYVTGLRVTPDQRAIVHHTIVFVASPEQVAQYEAYDAAEDGPGYTCYGGPRGSTEDGGGGGLGNLDPQRLIAALNKLGLTLADLQAGKVTSEQMTALITELLGGDRNASSAGFASIGSWVPGVPANPYPAGTGIRVEPGSMLIVQMHYNTQSASPVADQSTIEIATVPTVEREAVNLAVVDLGWVTNGMFGDPMDIPAGADNVAHDTTADFDSILVLAARQSLGLADDESLVIHSANHHMHELGSTQRTEVQHADGSTSCLLENPDWDFNWQGSYTLSEPVVFQPGDSLWMGCAWDNSAANQPIIDGEAREPSDVAWGEGTSDEMCLGSFYVTAE